MENDSLLSQSNNASYGAQWKLQVEYLEPGIPEQMDSWLGVPLEDAQPPAWKPVSPSEEILGTLMQWPSFEGQELKDFPDLKNSRDFPADNGKYATAKIQQTSTEQPSKTTYIRVNMSKKDFEKKYDTVHGKNVLATSNSIKEKDRQRPSTPTSRHPAGQENAQSPAR